jgi:PAS domain S-box-containing protein
MNNANNFSTSLKVMSILIFVSMLIAIAYISFKIENYEDQGFLAIVQNEAEHTAQDFSQYQKTLYGSLDRIAVRWSTEGGTSQKVFVADAQAHIRDYPTIMGISYVNKDYILTWIVPEKYKRLVGFNYSTEGERANTIKEAIATHHAQTTHALKLLSNQEVGFIYIAPLYVNNQLDGLLVAGFSAVYSIKYLHKTVLENFYMTVTEEKSLVFRNVPASLREDMKWSRSAKIIINNREWEFSLIPNARYLANKNSNMPLIILLFGWAISFVTAMAIFLGITARKTARALSHAQIELRKNKDWLQGIMDASHHSIIATDLNGTIQLFNHAAERMLGYKAQEMIAKHTPELIHDANEVLLHSQELSKLLGREVEPGFSTFIAKVNAKQDQQEWTYVRKDKTTFPVWLSLSALRVDNKIAGYVGIAQDISDRKALEAMKNEFISIVSHELRTPLTSIQGVLALLLGGALGNFEDRAEKMLTIAHNNCERLIRLINDILDVEKIDAGHIEFHLRTIDLNQLVEETMLANHAYAEKFDVSLKFIPYPVPLFVKVDSDRMLQVFTNLISNAVKFSPSKAEVTVKVDFKNGMAVIAIEDHGAGIPEAFHKDIFQKFSQADSSTVRKMGGTGLGLHISKSIVDKLGGNISFESKHNIGTTFFISLPAAAMKKSL